MPEPCGSVRPFMRFGVVSQRLEMADAFNRRDDRLLVQDAARSERDVQAETVVHDLLDDLQLHRAHQLQVHFL